MRGTVQVIWYVNMKTTMTLTMLDFHFTFRGGICGPCTQVDLVILKIQINVQSDNL